MTTRSTTVQRGEVARRTFLGHAGLTLAGVAASASGSSADGAPETALSAALVANNGRWEQVRAMFPLDENYVHMSALLIASHPRPVAEAIET